MISIQFPGKLYSECRFDLKLIESFSLHPFYLAKVGSKLPCRQFSSVVGGGVGEFSESALLDGSGLHQREIRASWGKLAKLAGINFVKSKTTYCPSCLHAYEQENTV